MKYVNSKGEVFDIETVSTPHLINAMKKYLKEAERRRTKHLRYMTILNPLVILEAPRLREYAEKDLHTVRDELIRRGYESIYEEELRVRERISDSCVLINNYLHIFGIMRRAEAVEVLKGALDEVYENNKEEIL